jgi:hypothetical protein
MSVFRKLAIAGAIGALGLPFSAHAADYKPEERYEKGEAREAAHAPYRSRTKRAHAPYRDCCGAYRFVYAESWWGQKRVVAPVRRTPLGPQVRLPGGLWVYCEVSCEYTLRKQSLDAWKGAVKGGEDISPGYFSVDIYFDEYGRPHRYPF